MAPSVSTAPPFVFALKNDRWFVITYRRTSNNNTVVLQTEITAIVLSLETTGPMLIKALQSQDMYLAGSFLMFLAFLTVIGVLISDIALAILDPRIRLQGGSTK